ncbi:MAG: S8 family serine peptidase [Candidatus Aenigmatarchaeota archaeon]|nr:MAG: S8 family serine peptidase [Candidatus Aenigmarchaeota archaeon]
MPRMSELGTFFVLVFLVIVLFAVSFAPLTVYLAAVSGKGGVMDTFDSKGVISYSSYYAGTDLRSVVDSKGVTYVDDEVIDEFYENDVVRVIIKFKGDIEDLSGMEGFEKKREFRNFFSAELRKTGLLKLVDSLGDEIESIQVDHELFSMVDGAVPKIRADLAWDYGLTGKGQTVCVVDTGIDYNHESLSDKYLGGYDFVNDDPDPMDDNGHGTYVSGIISSVAPVAKIIAAKALGSEGKGYESDIIAAIDYCIENRDAYGISVIVLAFSGGSFDRYCDSVLVTKEANLASEKGIFVVAASGNGRSDELTAPACGTKVTSVGATTKNDLIACGTNINPLLDLLAPGEGGTSASTAVAAGAAMLVLENEPLEPMELEYRFRSTGFLIEHQGMDYPRIDVHNAIHNEITNAPGGQAGEQSEENWEGEYVASADCTCIGDGECSPGDFCCQRDWPDCEDCSPVESTGLCRSCLNEDEWGCDWGTGQEKSNTCCGTGCTGPRSDCSCDYE